MEGELGMINIALCGIPESIPRLQNALENHKYERQLNYNLLIFDNLEDLLTSKLPVKIFILNIDNRQNTEDRVRDYISSHKEKKGSERAYHYIIYIENPIDNNDCSTVIESIRQYLEYEAIYLCVDFLTDQGLKSIPIDSICYLEYENRKIKIVTKNTTYFTYDKMKNFITLLERYNFAVPHKSFIVNFQFIRNIKNYEIGMHNGTIIPLSQKRSHQFRNQYRLFLQRHNMRLEKKQATILP